MVSVSKVDDEHISVIQQLADTTWRAAYSTIITPQQLEYMLNLFYSKSALQKQIESGHQFIVATEDKVTTGFASYSLKSATEPKVYRLHKIYINPNQQGKGIGKNLIDFIVDDIKPQQATDLELNVNRNNKALHFYQKLGFKIVKEEDIDIGEGYFMNDFVLKLPL